MTTINNPLIDNKDNDITNITNEIKSLRKDVDALKFPNECTECLKITKYFIIIAFTSSVVSFFTTMIMNS